MRSDKALKRWYSKINREFFHSELPSNVCVRWADPDEEPDIASTDLGVDARHSFIIIFNREKVPTLTIKVATLIHEMMHVATKCEDDHGADFELVRQQLSDRGIFKKGAVVKGLTIF